MYYMLHNTFRLVLSKGKTMAHLAFIGVGIGLLLISGFLLVNGSVRIARSLGLSEFLIGVVLIGFGTSTPELITSVQAAWHGSPGLAFGNVVGSNISNILLILGISALFYPVSMARAQVVQDGYLLMGLMVLFVLCSMFFPLSRLVALFYVMVVVAYVLRVRQNSAPAHGVRSELVLPRLVGMDVAFAFAGVMGLLIGSHVLVTHAVALARLANISETVIGLTLVAVGTSLPELTSTVLAARKGKPELALGNVIGSNVFNVFGILGVTGLLAPTSVPTDVRFVYNPLMLLTTAVLIFMLFKHERLDRQAGYWFLGSFGTYTIFSVGISPFFM